MTCIWLWLTFDRSIHDVHKAKEPSQPTHPPPITPTKHVQCVASNSRDGIWSRLAYFLANPHQGEMFKNFQYIRYRGCRLFIIRVAFTHMVNTKYMRIHPTKQINWVYLSNNSHFDSPPVFLTKRTQTNRTLPMRGNTINEKNMTSPKSLTFDE